MNVLDVPDRDLYKGHQLLQQRLPAFIAEAQSMGYKLVIIEIFRPEERQQWLYGQGRTPAQCSVKGVPVDYARPGAVVTNAWSAKTSAHGYEEAGLPASCAADLVPTGADGKPWTTDDDWTAYLGVLEPIANKHGLRHFHAPGKAVWDKPHIQLVEWNDSTLTLDSTVPA